MAELESQVVTDAHEPFNVAMDQDYEHVQSSDEEGSESTSLEYFPMAAEGNQDDVGSRTRGSIKDTTHLPVLKADDDDLVGSSSTAGESAKNSLEQNNANIDEDKIAVGVTGFNNPVKSIEGASSKANVLQVTSATANSTPQEEMSMLRTSTTTLYSLELHTQTGLALTRQRPVWKARGPRSWMKSRAGSPPPTQLLRRCFGFRVPLVRASPLLLTASLVGGWKKMGASGRVSVLTDRLPHTTKDSSLPLPL
ncbi:hypothetical protein JOM56_000470, partial [Amanita muscaria]